MLPATTKHSNRTIYFHYCNSTYLMYNIFKKLHDILGGILEACTHDGLFVQCNIITSYRLASNDHCSQLVATIDCRAFKNFKHLFSVLSVHLLIMFFHLLITMPFNNIDIYQLWLVFCSWY